MNVHKVDVSAGETLVVPPGFLQSACAVHKEVVTGVRRTFLPSGPTNLKRLMAVSEMIADAPATEQIIKATIDALSLA